MGCGAIYIPIHIDWDPSLLPALPHADFSSDSRSVFFFIAPPKWNYVYTVHTAVCNLCISFLNGMIYCMTPNYDFRNDGGAWFGLDCCCCYCYFFFCSHSFIIDFILLVSFYKQSNNNEIAAKSMEEISVCAALNQIKLNFKSQSQSLRSIGKNWWVIWFITIAGPHSWATCMSNMHTMWWKCMEMIFYQMAFKRAVKTILLCIYFSSKNKASVQQVQPRQSDEIEEKKCEWKLKKITEQWLQFTAMTNIVIILFPITSFHFYFVEKKKNIVYVNAPVFRLI